MTCVYVGRDFLKRNFFRVLLIEVLNGSLQTGGWKESHPKNVFAFQKVPHNDDKLSLGVNHKVDLYTVMMVMVG